MSAGVIGRLEWDQRIFSGGSLMWLESWWEASVSHVDLSMRLPGCPQDIAAGFPQRKQFKREKEPGGNCNLFGIQLWKSHSIPSATFHSLKTESPRYGPHSRGGHYSLFKGGVSKNLWTYVKLPYLVACGATVKPSSSECEVLLDPM